MSVPRLASPVPVPSRCPAIVQPLSTDCNLVHAQIESEQLLGYRTYNALSCAGCLVCQIAVHVYTTCSAYDIVMYSSDQ